MEEEQSQPAISSATPSESSQSRPRIPVRNKNPLSSPKTVGALRLFGTASSSSNSTVGMRLLKKENTDIKRSPKSTKLQRMATSKSLVSHRANNADQRSLQNFDASEVLKALPGGLTAPQHSPASSSVERKPKNESVSEAEVMAKVLEVPDLQMPLTASSSSSDSVEPATSKLKSAPNSLNRARSDVSKKRFVFEKSRTQLVIPKFQTSTKYPTNARTQRHDCLHSAPKAKQADKAAKRKASPQTQKGASPTVKAEEPPELKDDLDKTLVNTEKEECDQIAEKPYQQEEPLTFEALKLKLANSQSEFMDQLLTLKSSGDEIDNVSVDQFKLIGMAIENGTEILVNEEYRLKLPEHLPQRSIGDVKYKIQQSLRDCLEFNVRTIRKYMEDCKASKRNVDLEELCLKLELEQESKMASCLSNINEFHDPKEGEEIRELQKLLSDTKSSAQRSIEELKQQIVDLKKQLDALLEDLDAKIEESEELSVEVNRLQETRIELQRLKKRMEHDLDEVRCERDAAHQRIQDLLQEIDEIRAVLQDQERTIAANNFEHQRASYEERIQDLQIRLHTEQIENQRNLQSLAKEVGQREQAYEAKIKERDAQKDECLHFIMQRTIEMEQFQSQFCELKESHHQLKVNLGQADGELSDVKRELEERRRYIIQLEQGNRELQMMKRESDRELEELRRRQPQSVLTFQFDKTPEPAVCQTTTSDEVDSDVENIRDELESLRVQYDSLKSQLRYVLMENSHFRRENKSVKGQLEKTFDDIKGCVEHAIQLNEHDCGKNEDNHEFHPKMRALIRALKIITGCDPEMADTVGVCAEPSVRHLRRSLAESRETLSRLKKLAESRGELLEACRNSEVSLRTTINQCKEELSQKNKELDELKRCYQDFLAANKIEGGDSSYPMTKVTPMRRLMN